MTYKIEQFVKKIKCPVLVKLEDSELRFENGEQLAEYDFNKSYIISSITAVDSMIVLSLVENNRINDTNWCGEEQVGFF